MGVEVLMVTFVPDATPTTVMYARLIGEPRTEIGLPVGYDEDAMHLAETVRRNEQRAVVRERLRERVELVDDDRRGGRDAERTRREDGAGALVLAHQAAVHLARRHRDGLDLAARDEEVLHERDLRGLPGGRVVLLDDDIGRLATGVGDDDAPRGAGGVVREVVFLVQVDRPELAADVRAQRRDGIAAGLAGAADARLIGAVAVTELLGGGAPVGRALEDVLADADASVHAGLPRREARTADGRAAGARVRVRVESPLRARAARHGDDGSECQEQARSLDLSHGPRQ